ncbi:sugar ABC transporter substrate-binding protein [Paenibacillus pinistramenti]|uniref:sugar ABC transporter substrate-binding protein n=1 Tax=Paenibacillus pinistramenti TaxID=1768003 RepID=UPI001108EC40|nr:substrate-binding domain-containing protein [Paenibacillus pinistramenti]
MTSRFRARAVKLAVLIVGAAIILSISLKPDNEGNVHQLNEAAPLPHASNDGAPLTFGIIYPMVNDTYEMVTQNAEAAASDQNIKLIVQAPDEANLEQQIRIVEMMIKQEVDGIAIDPIDSEALINVINKAVSSGIPVVCFESDSPSSERNSFIGADNYKTGTMIGQAVDSLLGGKGMVLVQTGMPHMLGLTQRLQGFQDYVAEHTGIDILDVRHNDGSEGDAIVQLEQMITAHPHFSALINLDYVSSSSSVLVWKAKGLNRYNVSLGLTPYVSQSIANGQITSVISQNEQNWGQAVINTLHNLVQDKTMPEFINTEITEITE